MVEITELMTPNPVCVPTTCTIADAARRMRDDDIGDVLVMDGETIRGILTDRDVVVRAIASGDDPATAIVTDYCSPDVISVSPRETLDDALRVMRDHALRRVPVVENGRPIGMLTMGDVAIDREPMSILADVSGAPPNH